MSRVRGLLIPVLKMYDKSNNQNKLLI